MRTIVWFRSDLRLDDHLPLIDALEVSDPILVYVLDQRETAILPPPIDRPRTGPHRARFLAESLSELRASVRKRGSELFVRKGDAVEVVAELAETLKANVYAHALYADEERNVEAKLKKRLEAIGLELKLFPGHTLISPEALPFPLARLPEVFSKFRRAVERRLEIDEPAPAPQCLPPPNLDWAPGEIPTAENFSLEALAPLPSPERYLRGGEEAGRAYFQNWVFELRGLGTYKETRNGMLNPQDSSRLSPWLALGCISSRWAMSEVRRYEALHGANESTYWLLFELFWRDYFAFLSLKEGPQLFRRSGVGRRVMDWKRDPEAFSAWMKGETGYPLVDANMRELNATGYMSNRGRQNVASFLTKALKIDWRWGAAYFECQLIDYDPGSNYGNWQYVAGVGNDPRDRVFNVVKQSRDYDPDGDYLRTWLPELVSLDAQSVHEPWLHPGKLNYPRPIIRPRRPHAFG